MKYYKMAWLGLVIETLAGLCGSVVSYADNTLTGKAAASALNEAYAKTGNECANHLAALWCSGVLVRQIDAATDSGPWIASPDEKRTGALAPVFLRSDLDAAALLSAPGGIGLAYTLPAIAEEAGLPEGSDQRLKPYCVFPTRIDTSNRTAHGCWPAGGEIHSDSTDPSSCGALGVTTAAAWSDADPAKTCSWSTSIGAQFVQVITLSNGKSSLPQVQAPIWNDKAIAERLPVKAFVYLSGDNSGLQHAQQARAYFKLLHAQVDIPVLAIKKIDSRQISFLYQSADNVDIAVTATQRLNAAYVNNRLQVANVMQKPAEDFATSTTVLPALNSSTIEDGKLLAGNVGVKGFSPANNLFAGHLGDEVYGLVVEENGQTHSVDKPVAIFYNHSPAHAYYLQSYFYEQLGGKILPIVQLDTAELGKGASAKRAFVEQNDIQVVFAQKGPAVQDDLNARVKNQVNDCNSRPAHMCSGVLMRATGADMNSASNPYFPWGYPDDKVRKGKVSFSYLRWDTKTKAMYKNHQGIIFKSSAQAEADRQPLNLTCFYPTDAATDDEKNKDNWNGQQCWQRQIAGHTADPNDLSSCSAAHPNTNSTIADWKDVWRTDFQTNSFNHVCSLSTKDKTQFAAAIALSGEHLVDWSDWNEILVAPWNTTVSPKNWDRNMAGNIPLEAFYYDDSSAKAAAFNYQQLFIKKYGIYVPVVHVQFNGGNTIFEYAGMTTTH